MENKSLIGFSDTEIKNKYMKFKVLADGIFLTIYATYPH
jgi:hypothetical protein